ncbi:MAG: GNAT family N-acetyltransferase [Actinobacteria bacterium]|nr:GNAT family N-acetyltransferase [Actinomycetota bacterium]
MLRPLAAQDFRSWSEVRQRNADWLTVWEPRRPDQLADPTTNRSAFNARCQQRDRDRTSGTAYQFGLFIDRQIAGEVNLNNVIRGAMQSGTVGYWIDQRHAGHSYVAEGVVLVMQFAFEQLQLHRLEICIVRPTAQRGLLRSFSNQRDQRCHAPCEEPRHVHDAPACAASTSWSSNAVWSGCVWRAFSSLPLHRDDA